MEYSFLPTLTPFVTALSLLIQDNATNSSDSTRKKKKKVQYSSVIWAICCAPTSVILWRVLNILPYSCCNSTVCGNALMHIPIPFHLNGCILRSNFACRSYVVVYLIPTPKLMAALTKTRHSCKI